MFKNIFEEQLCCDLTRRIAGTSIIPRHSNINITTTTFHQI